LKAFLAMRRSIIWSPCTQICILKTATFNSGNLRTSDENPFERSWEGFLNYSHKFAKPGKLLNIIVVP
jgi:hypothetical protein